MTNPSMDQFTPALVRFVLDNAVQFDWTVQGFGMMRTYLDTEKRFRLNVYNSALRTASVSDIHNHPWHFRSLIVCGRLWNTQFIRTDPFDDHPDAYDYNCVRIKTGEGGGPLEQTGTIRLRKRTPTMYRAGEIYLQAAPDLHRVNFTDGTVTINDRTKLCAEDEQEALVCWREGAWVNAEPRPATRDEIDLAVWHARALLVERIHITSSGNPYEAARRH